MGKRAELQPAWLVGLLNQWAIHDLRSQTGGLGYASGSSWMRGLKSSPSSSIDPTGFAARDFGDVDSAMNDLMDAAKNHWAAVTMYYKPWVIQSFQAQGFPFQNTTYFDRLHRGHTMLERLIQALRQTRMGTWEEAA